MARETVLARETVQARRMVVALARRLAELAL